MISSDRKNFIWRNEGFRCEHCREENPPAEGSARNHCRRCLFSKHVDETIPGDRESSCGGMMKPTDIDYRGEKGYQLIHQCLMCGKKMKNILAEDDDLHEFMKISPRAPRGASNTSYIRRSNNPSSHA